MEFCCSRRSLLLGALGATALSGLGLSRAALADAPRLRVGGPPRIGGLVALAGSLHDHTTDSDGDASSTVVADYVQAFHDQLGLDFLSLTEHSDFFPVAVAGVNPWQRSRAVTDAHTGGTFTMLRGFEHTNDQENHLNVIESANWLRRTDDLMMTPFYRWLATTPAVAEPLGTGLVYGGADGIGQFNHPSSKGALNWDDYTYDAAAAKVMGTIEVREGASGWYWFALSKGWTLGPVQNADYHPWQASGVLANANPGDRTAAGRLPFHRTLVLATENSRAAIVEALKQRRTTAVEQPDQWATLRGPGGVWQGSTITAEPGQPIELLVDAGTERSALASVSIVTSGVASDYGEFYGDNKECVSIDNPGDPGNGCNQHIPSYELQRQRFADSGGKTTFKGPKDAPPAGRTLPAVPLSGSRAQVRIPVTVPTTASTRPDGRQFFYAVVTRADGSRAFTSPVFVETGLPAAVVPEAPVALALPLAGAAVAAGAYALTRRRAAHSSAVGDQ